MDYRNYKTPYFKISVGKSSASIKDFVELPSHIHRLIEKIELTEALDLGEGEEEYSGMTTLSIHFVEGSREPASPDSNLGTSGRYNIPFTSDGQNNTAIAGSITNRIGSVADLRFSGLNGITNLTESEQEAGEIDNSLQENVDGEYVDRRNEKENSTPRFLFQERNKVKIEWGYRNSTVPARKKILQIAHVEGDFPEKGSPRLVVRCVPAIASLDQIAPAKGGILFSARRIPKKGSSSLIVFEDFKTEDLVRKVAEDLGMKAIVSRNLPSSTEDSDKVKMWPAGQSLRQFWSRLAAETNCYFTTEYNPNNGVATVVFINKKDFESKLTILDRTLTTYRHPNTLLRSVKVLADFNSDIGSSQVAMDENGQVKGGNSNTAQSEVGVFGNEKTIPSSPTGEGNEVPEAKALTDNLLKDTGYTGKTKMNASTSQGDLEDKARVEADKMRRKVTVNFTAIGDTRFTPGTLEIKGIGVRYSGKYRILTVTHAIDATGYSVNGSGTTFSLSSEGLTNSEGEQLKEEQDRSQTSITEFGQAEAEENVPVGGELTIRDEYNKFNNTDKR